MTSERSRREFIKLMAGTPLMVGAVSPLITGLAGGLVNKAVAAESGTDPNDVKNYV